MSDLYRDFICACLGGRTGQVRTFLQDPRWNWELLIQAASREMVLPALSGAIPGAPADIVDFLSAVELLSAERNAAIFDELTTVVRLLNQIGIEPVLLKGVAYLVVGVYQNPAARYMMDIDLLIPRSQLNAAAEVLASNGFERDDADQFGRFRHHHPPLRRSGSVPIELHHCLGLGRSGSILSAEELFASAVPHDLNGRRVRIPSPENLLSHLILHSQMVHPYYERIWPPLRALYDFALLQNRFREAIDWTKIEQRFRAARRYGVFALHLLYVRENLGVPLPVSGRMTPFLHLRRYRRDLLRRLPAVRYLDPIYMVSTVCIRRLRVLRNVLRTPAGMRHLFGQLLESGVYQRLLSDVVEGRGR